MDHPVAAPAPRGLLPSPLQELQDDRFTARGLRLWLKRDDLIDPELPGNKWRKLKYNLADARAAGHRTLLTFGGAYSNHIRATAAAGARYGFATIGVIRGDELADRPLNDSLRFAADRGMRLVFVDRTAYRRRAEPEYLAGLAEELGEFFAIPEGGSNPAAVRGCAELPAEIDVPYAAIAVACGTGGTLAGLAAGLPEGREALGFAVLKGDFLTADVAELQRRTYGAATGNWRVETGFHCGGYARSTPELHEFTADFEARHGIAVDEVYVGKMLYGLTELAGQGAFAPGTGIVAVKTG
ncbi:1-aminocyclopropane-1-carboxylate deaminase/D-cysteine desulfhydrase [Yinghuangia soli]|uniref:Pyridoxal-phosphate dependent enzyme n=1 Tax=Yinghuangia soli TaxID=2908204 RepID=A0AA41Q837_9ACTN|nr:pyridoxal-phosphate dependent enzyme [Yinghuangia soli]MCF2532119.1 pyridoxal-phosphate dependent enzyme [Yinghuangia soli]